MEVYCNNDGELMGLTEEDSRGEWYEATYCCPECSSIKTHRKEFDQNGKTILDEVIKQ